MFDSNKVSCNIQNLASSLMAYTEVKIEPQIKDFSSKKKCYISAAYKNHFFSLLISKQ